MDTSPFFEVHQPPNRANPTTVDALAREGTRLTNFNVEPSCTPSRSALMTGRHPIRDGTIHRLQNGLECEILISSDSKRIMNESIRRFPAMRNRHRKRKNPSAVTMKITGESRWEQPGP